MRNVGAGHGSLERMGRAMKTVPAITSVYDGRTCVGFTIDRGVRGFEAFDQHDHSLGLFNSIPEAANAIADRITGTSSS
jgi:hypothetical protein